MAISLEQAWAEAPVVAIVRGVRPDEVVGVAEALCAEGVRIVEVPLNSPEPFDSLRRLVAAVGERMVCGSGTVLSPGDADACADAGGRVCVSPNTDPAVIRRALERGMTPMPGWGSVTEAFTAYAAGARWLKLFPAASYGPGHLKQALAVLPKDAVHIAVGGVGAAQVADWRAAGVHGFGVGSELYKPGDTVDVVRGKAAMFMAALRAKPNG
jgi:2-dehydro-3-deoxyphosphogalactonate aldolase